MATDDHAGLGWPAGGLRFEPEVERAFLATLGADAWVRVRVVIVVALAGTVGYLVLAPAEDPGGFERVAPYLSVVVLLAQLGWSFRPAAERSLRWAVPLTWLTIGGVAVVATLRAAQGHGTVTFDVVVVFVLAVYFAAGVGIAQAGAVAVAVSVAWIALGVAFDVPRPEFPFEVLLLVATNAVGAFGALVLEVERRRAFELQQRLESAAFTDALTGLPDRRGFDQRLDDVWAVAVGEQRSVGLALLDVDWFKAVNERGGHAAGDEGLRLVAAHLQAQLRRPLDLAGRVGGDEFAAIWYDVDERWLAATLDRLGAEIAEASEAATGLAVTVSIGAVHVARPAGEPRSARLAADQALLRAKAAGRGHVELVRPSW